jgi:serpin B
MIKRWIGTTLLLLTLTFSAAGAQDTDGGGTMEAGNIAFALDLLAQLQAAEGNTVVSPFSIQNAFWLAYMGANGTTADQMRQVFRFPDLDNLAASSGMAVEPTAEPTEDFTLGEASGMWAQQGFPWRPEYIQNTRGWSSPMRSTSMPSG